MKKGLKRDRSAGKIQLSHGLDVLVAIRKRREENEH
jgi:hypothetical protein